MADFSSSATSSRSAATLTTGICSVTLRNHIIDEVVAIAADAGLGGVEWGADVHVVDSDSAEHARSACATAGLKVLSLGSYYRCGTFGDFEDIVALAVQAGAPRVRIWAGTVEPNDADQQAWDAVVQDTWRIAALAAEQGLQLAFEFHRGTLTSTAEGALKLLKLVDRANVGTYWQPPVGLNDQEALASLRQITGHLMGVHCFSWAPDAQRLPLEARKLLWQDVSKIVMESSRNTDIMLEFVEADSPANVTRDAIVLRQIISQAV